MSPNATPPDPRECEVVVDLLSWHANGTLGTNDRATVDAHTAVCDACRTTLAVERRIVEAMRAPRDNVEQSPHAGWQKLSARLDADEGASSITASGEAPGHAAAVTNGGSSAPSKESVRTLRGRVNWPAALGAAVAVQAAAIAVLAVALVRHRQIEQAPRYYTLAPGDPTLLAEGPLVRIAFDSTVDEPAAKALASREKARIRSGPSPENVYTFEFAKGTDAAGELDGKVSTLRREAHVLLVEPVILLKSESHKEQ